MKYEYSENDPRPTRKRLIRVPQLSFIMEVLGERRRLVAIFVVGQSCLIFLKTEGRSGKSRSVRSKRDLNSCEGILCSTRSNREGA